MFIFHQFIVFGSKRLPAAAAALECWRHTAAAGLSSGFHVSDADAASRSSVSCPPGLQTGKVTQILGLTWYFGFRFSLYRKCKTFLAYYFQFHNSPVVGRDYLVLLRLPV